jgi:hypothetical protein
MAVKPKRNYTYPRATASRRSNLRQLYGELDRICCHAACVFIDA